MIHVFLRPGRNKRVSLGKCLFKDHVSSLLETLVSVVPELKRWRQIAERSVLVQNRQKESSRPARDPY